ncbi:hypothetical protein DPMN_046544 [Dreissena polymorpha]|uniref:Uncharacterized protein n=2 Tax=Dreissena polymorpha TaxID=45954 RepID=A0A9D4I0M3_DREPO|nr:hypothetical protein DPMN_046544 [Dreissena polymorpha]
MTGGISAALLGIAAPAGATGVAAVAFLDAKEKREEANKQKRLAESKRSDVESKRRNQQEIQASIDVDLIEKTKLHNFSLKIQAEIGDLENMHGNLSAFEVILDSKISSSEKLPTSVPKHTSAKVEEGSITDKVDKELHEIFKNIWEAKRAKVSGKHNEKYVRETIPWIEYRISQFKQAMSTTYKHILDRKEMDSKSKEAKELMQLLESTYKEITDLEQNIGNDMISRMKIIMKEQNVLKKLYYEVQAFEEDIRNMEGKRTVLQKQAVAFQFEAQTLEKLALKKGYEMATKLAVGSGSIGVLAASAMAAPLTGGASLVAAGASGALAAYNFMSAYECYELAKQKQKQSEQNREQANAVHWRINKTQMDINTREEHKREALSLIGQLKADQTILQNILKQLIKFSDVINSITVFLQYTKPYNPSTDVKSCRIM